MCSSLMYNPASLTLKSIRTCEFILNGLSRNFYERELLEDRALHGF